MTEPTDDFLVVTIGRLCRDHDLEIYYTIDDDGIHISRGGRDIYIGYSENLPTQVEK